MKLNAHQINVDLGAQRVLHDISLSVEPGEFLVILGPNGAGKSTLLNVLSGERVADVGTASLDGIALHDFTPLELARKRALMLQRASLTFPFVVRDVVAMGREPFLDAGDVKADEMAVDWALEATDMHSLQQRPYTKLSGGEQQRVQLARVLAQIWRPSNDEARFLLLDEPTSSLDLAHQHTTMRLAHKLTTQGVGAVAVVHDLNLAALYATKVALLSQGHLVALGTPDQILAPDLISEVFGISVTQVRDEASGRTLIVPVGLYSDATRPAPLQAAQ
ncbi:MAG: heme ABC transporter ATP-binding protein [Rhodobacteraceae bacterium]|nr:heme ABC transporter ATP-binding protein [Paracoccaceae bacterium]